jgi:ATP-dependent DNA helicase RecG
MREVYAFVDRYNRTKSKIVGLERIDVREYPESALREALLNSIVHKDYGFGSSTLVSVFDDRIEVLTVGALVKGLTKEDIMIGTSLLRNKNLANVFYRLKWIEAYGTGILKIKEAYENVNVKPLIEITDNAFKITLPVISDIDVDITHEVKFNSSETKILNMFVNNEEIKRLNIEEELKISQPMAVKLLKSLLDKDAIIRIGTGKNIVYKVKTNSL